MTTRKKPATPGIAALETKIVRLQAELERANDRIGYLTEQRTDVAKNISDETARRKLVEDKAANLEFERNNLRIERDAFRREADLWRGIACALEPGKAVAAVKAAGGVQLGVVDPGREMHWSKADAWAEPSRLRDGPLKRF